MHNKFVCDDLRAKGAVFIEELNEVPAGSTVIFSAHGVSKAVRDEAETRGLKVFDATCPLVTKVHVEVGKMRNQAREVVMIGHKGHPEVEGTMGQSSDGMFLVETAEDVARLKVSQPEKLSFVTQTTLSVDDASKVIDALKVQFPKVQGPKKDDICYATQNRQDAVKAMAELCDLVLVVGSTNSSNSRRLKEVALARGIDAYLLDGPEEIQANWLAGKTRIGVTAGASAPEILVRQVVDRIVGLTNAVVEQLQGVEEEFPSHYQRSSCLAKCVWFALHDVICF